MTSAAREGGAGAAAAASGRSHSRTPCTPRDSGRDGTSDAPHLGFSQPVQAGPAGASAPHAQQVRSNRWDARSGIAEAPGPVRLLRMVPPPPHEQTNNTGWGGGESGARSGPAAASRGLGAEPERQSPRRHWESRPRRTGAETLPRSSGPCASLHHSCSLPLGPWVRPSPACRATTASCRLRPIRGERDSRCSVGLPAAPAAHQ